MGRSEHLETGRSALLLLTLFTLVGAVLRAVGLDSQLWCDEIITLVNGVRVPTQTLLTSYFYDNQHTLYALLAQASVAAFGEHAWTVRLPAMLLGTAAIPALYLLGREVTDRFEALAAAGLLAVSYHHVWFSQNARGYTGLMLATVLATLFLVRGLKRPGWRPWLLYALTVALGAYTHLTMVFVAVSHALLCAGLVLWPGRAGAWRTDWRRPAAALGLAAALTLLLYAPMLGDVLNFYLHKPTGMKAVSTPRWALLEAWTILQKGLGERPLVAVPVLLGAVLVAVWGLWSYWRQDRFVLLLFVLPALMTLGGALAARGTMYPRFFFYLCGFALLIGTRGAAVLGQGLTALLAPGTSAPLPRPTGKVLVAVLMICSAVSLAGNYRLPKQDFAGAMALVEAKRADGDTVVTVGFPATFCYQQYYGRPWSELRDVGQLADLRGAGRPVWLVYTSPIYVRQSEPELAEAIDKQFTVMGKFYGTLGGGTVFVCRAEPTPPAEQSP